MPSYFSTASIVANVHRFGRFYLASALLALLTTLLLLSAHREQDAAAPPPDYALLGAARQVPASAPRHWVPLRPRPGR